jgi:sporulation protein YlmC with PRC-barrel domain
MVTTFHAFKGLAVLDARGEAVGRVVDVEFDPGDWSIQALVVHLERGAAEKLGLKRLIGTTDLALKIIHVQAVTDTVLLRETLDQLAEVAPPGNAEAESAQPH